MIIELLRKNVEQQGVADKTAVLSDDGQITYGELLARVDVFAESLKEAGLGKGQVLLAYLDNVPAFVVAQLASTKIGCTFAPIDMGSTHGEFRNKIALTGSDLVVCSTSDQDHCQQYTKNLILVDAVGELKGIHAEMPGFSISGDVAVMQFSSGSTAASKGILLSPEAFFYRSYLLNQALGLSEDDRTICVLPLSHTHGSECLAIPTLMGCGTLYLKSPKFSFPLYILEELEKHKITFFSSIPQFYDFSVKLDGRSFDLSSLRHPFCGSAALARSTAESFYDKYGVHIKQGYGLAELSVICINQHDSGPVVYDSVGKVIPGIEWKLLGGDQEGELLVQSKAMFSGYINDEENTREKLQGGWLHTGDIVRVDEYGLLRIVGRKEDFIKVNGFKVYASEVEKVLVGHDAIKECAVLSEKDDVGTEKIVAHVVLGDWCEQKDDMTQELLVYLRDKISDYKIPKKILFQRELPKNALGKILKSRIRDGAANQAELVNS